MKLKYGFTLAEVLLTLAVIGIVAAITLPSLLVDTAEKAFDAQRRALHARLAQAIGMMSTLSGYGTYTEETKEGAEDAVDNAAETFLYEGLSKVYKMNNICDSDNLDKCGIPLSFTNASGESVDFPKKLSELNPRLVNDPDNGGNAETDKQTMDTKAAAFETVNGESVAVFYNPNCKNKNEGSIPTYNPTSWKERFYIANKMCVNFVYDLNGAKGPNKAGRDIGFITALYSKNSEVVAPVQFGDDAAGAKTQQEAAEYCANLSDESRLPNIDELSAVFYNSENLAPKLIDAGYWSSSVNSSELSWALGADRGIKDNSVRTGKHYARCIKK